MRFWGLGLTPLACNHAQGFQLSEESDVATEAGQESPISEFLKTTPLQSHHAVHFKTPLAFLVPQRDSQLGKHPYKAYVPLEDPSERHSHRIPSIHIVQCEVQILGMNNMV